MISISRQAAVTLFLLLSSYPCYAEDAWSTLITQIKSASDVKDYTQAEQLAIQALQMIENGQDTNTGRHIYSLYELGEIYRAQNKLSQAQNYLKQAYETSLSTEGDKPVLPRLMLCSRLAAVLFDDSKSDEAETVLHSCLNKEPPQSFDQNYYDVRVQLIRVLQVKGKLAEAESLARDQLTYVQRTLPPDSLEITNGLTMLSQSIRGQDLGNRLGEALGYMQQAWAICVKTSNENNLSCAGIEDNLGELLSVQNHLGDAEKHTLHALQVRTAQLGENHPYTASTASNLARIYFFQGRYEEAVPILQKVVNIYKTIYGKKSQYMVDVQNYLVKSLRKLGRDKEADRLQRENGMWIVD